MQTQTVQTSPLGNGALPARPSFAAPDDGQFQQALSREMAARQPEPEAPARPAPRQAAPAKPQTQPAKPAAQQQSKPAADAAAPAPQQADAAAKPELSATSGSNSTASAGDKPADTAQATDESAAQAASTADATAALLAMMAGYGQATAPPAAASDAGAAAAAADAAAIGAAGSAASSASAAAAAALAASTAADAAAAKAALAASGATDDAAAAAPTDAGAGKDAKAAAPHVEVETESLADAGLKPLSQQDQAQPAVKTDAAQAKQNQLADQLAVDSKSDTTALQTQQAKTDAAAPRLELKAQEAKPEITLTAPEAAPQPVVVAVPAALNAATTQAANAIAGNQLQARVGTQAWDQQLGQKVVWMVAGGDQSATLTLNPPDLGPLQVVLNVSNDQASVGFTAAQPEVRQALENALPRLKEMMSEAGIQLGQANVSAGDPGQQQAFAEAASGRSSGGRGHGGFGGGSDSGANNAQPAAAPRRSILGAVDTFA